MSDLADVHSNCLLRLHDCDLKYTRIGNTRNTNGLLQLTDSGLYCAAGDFYVDPWRSVQRAIITHAHGDHAYRGHARYLVATPGLRVFRTRLGPDATIK